MKTLWDLQYNAYLLIHLLQHYLIFCHEVGVKHNVIKVKIAWLVLLRSEIPSDMRAKLRTVAASNNRDHARNLSLHRLVIMFNRSHVNIGRATTSPSLLLLLARATYIMVLFFTHIPFMVNHIINATPPESLQQYLDCKHNQCFLSDVRSAAKIELLPFLHKSEQKTVFLNEMLKQQTRLKSAEISYVGTCFTTKGWFLEYSIPLIWYIKHLLFWFPCCQKWLRFWRTLEIMYENYGFLPFALTLTLSTLAQVTAHIGFFEAETNLPTNMDLASIGYQL